MLCLFLLYSKLTHSHTHTHILFLIFHHVISQEIEHSSLHCTVEPHCLSILFIIIIIIIIAFFRATPIAYGNSQARGQIRATAASLHHSHGNTGSELCLHHLQPTPQLMAMPDPE